MDAPSISAASQGRQFELWLGLALMAVSVTVLISLRRTHPYRRADRHGPFTGLEVTSRELELAFGSLVFLMGFGLVSQALRLETERLLLILLPSALAAVLGYAVRDIRRYEAAHPRRVAELRAEPHWMTGWWWWIIVNAATVGALFARSSEVRAWFILPVCMKVTYELLNTLSRALFRRSFRPPGRGDLVGRFATDWLLLPVWMAATVWGMLAWDALTRTLRGGGGAIEWPWFLG